MLSQPRFEPSLAANVTAQSLANSRSRKTYSGCACGSTGASCTAVRRALTQKSPDELFAKAVPTIFLAIQPYVVASAEKDPEIALKIADAFIARLPNSDENVGWLYTLKGNIYRDSGRFAEAINSLKKASVVSPRLTMPYLLLGLVLSDQGNSDGAIAEYAKAMHLDRNNVNAFNLRGPRIRQEGI